MKNYVKWNQSESHCDNVRHAASEQYNEAKRSEQKNVLQ